jgi:hypothetical protein
MLIDEGGKQKYLGNNGVLLRNRIVNYDTVNIDTEMNPGNQQDETEFLWPMYARSNVTEGHVNSLKQPRLRHKLHLRVPSSLFFDDISCIYECHSVALISHIDL